MRRWGTVLLVTAFLVVTVSMVSALNGDGRTSAIPFASDEGTIIARVFFDELETAYRLAASIEPLASPYERGYLLLALSAEELRQLRSDGFRTEIDLARTAQIDQPAQALPPGTVAIPGFPCYRTVEETFATMQSIVADYPNLASWIDVGDSWDKASGQGGYDMVVLRLTNSSVPGPKPKVLITSSLHAREYAPAELMTRAAEALVAFYGRNADATWILDHHEIHLMLQANPDGRKKAEAGILWRKNTNQNYCSIFNSFRGADLNRNFDFGWGCCGGSSSFTCSETYRGPSPASEPEVQAIQDYMMELFPDQRGPGLDDPAPQDATGLYLDIHSSGRLLLWPWGFTSAPAPNGTQLQTLGRKLAYFNGHFPEQAVGLYPTDGTTDNFAYGDLGVAAFTYELGTQFFESCGYFEDTLLRDNLRSILYAIKVARSPYQTPAGPDAVNVRLSAGAASPGIRPGEPVTLSAIINDTRYSNANGTETSQQIVAAEYYIDTPPWINNPAPMAVSMVPADGNFNSSVELVGAIIDTAGLSAGRHIIFVRGKDAHGNWGAFGARFLYVNGA